MNHKSFGIFLLSMFLFACASNVQRNENTVSAIQKSDNPPPSLGTGSQTSINGPFHILASIPYWNPAVIPNKVKSQCTELGRQLSDAVVKYALKQKINVIQKENSLPASGRSVELKVWRVLSAGHAFGAEFGSGHHKGIIVEAEILVDGSKVSSMTFRRTAGGGMFGDFKSSCSVLAGLAKKLGRDISEWLGTQ